jgi:hypothetical protein
MHLSAGLSLVALLTIAAPIPVDAQAQKQKPRPSAKPPAERKPAQSPKPPSPPPPPPAVTVVSKYVAGAESVESTVQSSGSRQRFDFASGPSLILQCDTKTAIQVSDLVRAYVATPLEQASAGPAPQPGLKGGPVTFKTTITDTGERKELFGLQARHVKSVTVREPSSTACDKSRTRSETDGWYVDLPVAMQCNGTSVPSHVNDAKASECADTATTESTGPSEALGYALAYTTTTAGEDGKNASTVSMEVIALKITPAEAARYQPPPEYARLESSDALVSLIARATQAAKAEQPKPAGTIRIGVVAPRNSSGASIEADAMGNELLQTLAVQKFEPVPLGATDPAQVDVEARQKQCDYVLYTDLVTAKSVSPGRIGGLVRKVPGNATPAGEENYEAKVEYRLVQPGNPKPVLMKNATAKSGGLTVRSVLNVARFAARLYFGMSGGIMQAMMRSAGGTGGGVGAADPMMNALDLMMNFGTPAEKAATKTLDGVVTAALQIQSTDLIKALNK